MLKNRIVSSLVLLGFGLYFSGCATMIDSTIDGIVYTTHSITGIPCPKKSGKIYIESTTAKDTQNVTPLNAQLNGFDNIVAKNIMQCDSLPELTDVLTEHGWEITENKEEADYQIYTSVVYCGYADVWLKNSNREIPMKERRYYKDFVIAMKERSIRDGMGTKATAKDIANQNEEILAQIAPNFDVTRVNKNYFNVFDYKYTDAPEHIKALANSNAVVSNAKLKNPNRITSHGIISGSNVAQMNSPNAGAVGAGMMAVGFLMGKGGLPEYSGYKSEIKIYNTKTKEIKIEYISGLSAMNSLVDKYKSYKYDADSLASGLFYK